TMSVSLPRTPNRTAPFVRDALDRLRGMPGVESAGAAAYLPLAASKVYEGMIYRVDPSEPRRSSRSISGSPGFFRTMGTPLLEGRDFAESDRDGPLVVIVSEAFARAYPNQKLAGRRIYLDSGGTREATIVGVVGSQRFLGPEGEPWEVIYR